MAKNLDKQIIAGNIFQRWRKLIQSANKSITIFSPYIDELIIELLQFTPDCIKPKQITVITNIDAQNIIPYKNSLRTLLSLMDEKINVKQLNDLHAKILLIDDSFVSLGSQNFTKRGRRNKEASIKLSETISDTDFLKKLHEWIDISESIDRGLIKKLLKLLPEYFDDYTNLIKNANKEFSKLSEPYSEPYKRRRALRQAEKKSRWKLKNENVLATIKDVNSFSHESYTGWYTTLILNDAINDNLTHWIYTNENESRRRDLYKFAYYPILNAYNFRMGFARVVKTRITYIRDDPIYFSREINGHNCYIGIHFPKRNTKIVNLILNLWVNSTHVLSVKLLFTGDMHKIVSKNYNKACTDELRKFTETTFFENKTIPLWIFIDLLQARIKKTNIKEKNIKKFLSGSNYRLSLIEYAYEPILTVLDTRYI